MIECYIKGCMDLDDPFYVPEILSGLSEDRRNRIMKYKMPNDRKRGLQAGIMIRDILKVHGRSQDEIIVSDNGRPIIEGLDFNISHSGKYVMMVISDDKVGCDIERIKGRNYSVAKRYFSEGEKNYLDESTDKDLSFYRIWTARESYIKYTGEGILLDFTKYEVNILDDIEDYEDILPSNICDGEYLGLVSINREDSLQNVIIKQWLYDNKYVASVCVSKKELK